MTDVVPKLTEDEAACLLIMKEGQALVDIGEFSKWHNPLLSLSRRGLCATAQKFNNGYEYVITDTGRQVVEAWEDQSLRDVIEANNKVASNRVSGSWQGYAGTFVTDESQSQVAHKNAEKDAGDRKRLEGAREELERLWAAAHPGEEFPYAAFGYDW